MSEDQKLDNRTETGSSIHHLPESDLMSDSEYDCNSTRSVASSPSNSNFTPSPPLCPPPSLERESGLGFYYTPLSPMPVQSISEMDDVLGLNTRQSQQLHDSMRAAMEERGILGTLDFKRLTGAEEAALNEIYAQALETMLFLRENNLTEKQRLEMLKYRAEQCNENEDRYRELMRRIATRQRRGAVVAMSYYSTTVSNQSGESQASNAGSLEATHPQTQSPTVGSTTNIHGRTGQSLVDHEIRAMVGNLSPDTFFEFFCELEGHSVRRLMDAFESDEPTHAEE